MSWLQAINPFNKVVGVVSEYVEDKDKANELAVRVIQVADETYREELRTRTVPWVDALHKMGRQLNGWLAMGIGAYLVHRHPEISPATVAAILGPSGLYNWVKGRGK